MKLSKCKLRCLCCKSKTHRIDTCRKEIKLTSSELCYCYEKVNVVNVTKQKHTSMTYIPRGIQNPIESLLFLKSSVK